jgi:hypothetical protein
MQLGTEAQLDQDGDRVDETGAGQHLEPAIEVALVLKAAHCDVGREHRVDEDVQSGIDAVPEVHPLDHE